MSFLSVLIRSVSGRAVLSTNHCTNLLFRPLSSVANPRPAEMTKKNRVFVVGVGMTKFEKPGKHDGDYPEMAQEAVTKAFKDAKITYKDVDQATVGYVYGDSTCGQRALYDIGMTGIPIYNVNNNCATGASALHLAKQLVEGGVSKCVLALGFEKMERGSLASKFLDRTNPMDKHVEVMMNTFGIESTPFAAQMFGNAGKEHMQKYGSKVEHFMKIAYKNHLHSKNNPYAQFQNENSMEEIANSPHVHAFLTRLQCCPTSDGAAAAVVASEDFVQEHGLEDRAVEILAMEMTTDTQSTFKENSCIKMVGFDMTKAAANKVFHSTGYKPQDVDVIELHDCFSANELLTYEALGLCDEGKAGEFIDSGNNTYGGRHVVNPSGGLISKGHPLGATGLAQCAELCWQLRGEADKRQVVGAELALQHNLGLGGAAVVALYKLGFPEKRPMQGALQMNLIAAASANVFKCGPLFEMLGALLETEGAALVKKVNGVFGFRVNDGKGNDGFWVVNLKDGNGSIDYNGKSKVDVTLTMKDADLWELMTGNMNPQKAFFQGKLKLQGNMGLALRLRVLQDEVSKMTGSKL